MRSIEAKREFKNRVSKSFEAFFNFGCVQDSHSCVHI